MYGLNADIVIKDTILEKKIYGINILVEVITMNKIIKMSDNGFQLDGFQPDRDYFIIKTNHWFTCDKKKIIDSGRFKDLKVGLELTDIKFNKDGKYVIDFTIVSQSSSDALGSAQLNPLKVVSGRDTLVHYIYGRGFFTLCDKHKMDVIVSDNIKEITCPECATHLKSNTSVPTVNVVEGVKLLEHGGDKITIPKSSEQSSPPVQELVCLNCSHMFVDHQMYFEKDKPCRIVTCKCNNFISKSSSDKITIPKSSTQSSPPVQEFISWASKYYDMSIDEEKEFRNKLKLINSQSSSDNKSLDIINPRIDLLDSQERDISGGTIRPPKSNSKPPETSISYNEINELKRECLRIAFKDVDVTNSNNRTHGLKTARKLFEEAKGADYHNW